MRKRASLIIGFLCMLMAPFLLSGCGSSTKDAGADDTQITPETSFAGSASCNFCHSTIYEAFVESGHNYKLNKVDDGLIPYHPFSSIAGALELIGDDGTDPDDPDGVEGQTDNTLGTPLSYADVSYVIGGYGWKARWIDKNGYIVTGSAVQYNLDGTWSAYHDNEVDKKYNCGNCHTTGWKRYTDETGDDRNLNHQDGLPGMDGTFVFTGIQCESCHGAGAQHVASQKKEDIVRVATARTTADFLAEDMAFNKAVACSECHTRDGEKDYPGYSSSLLQAFPGAPRVGGRIVAKGSLIKHHEQYDEMLGLDPDDPIVGLGKHLAANVTCITCHDPHKTTKYQDSPSNLAGPGVIKDCMECHGAGEAFEIPMPTGSHFDCKDCHMPKLAKSAIKYDAVGTGPATGDITTHIFKINLDGSSQFTADGAFAYPWITKDFACLTCHNGIDASDRSTIDDTGYVFHE